MGIILNASTGISVDVATTIGCIIIVILAISGGLRTVAFTDAISAVIMVIGLVFAVPAILHAVGGWDFVVQQTPIENPLGLTFTGGWTWKNYLVNLLPPFLLQLGDQNLYQRMAAAVAFAITTGDSYLLSGATNISTDVFAFFKKDATDKQTLRVTQLSIAVFGILALGILKFFPSILAIQYWSYTIVGAGITPSLLGCVICPNKVSKWGGLATVLVAFPVILESLVWRQIFFFL